MTKQTISKTSSLAHLTIIPTREVFFKARPNEASHRKYYVKDRERKNLILEVKESGLVLFEYYLSLVGKQPHEEITDEKTAVYFGWDLAKAKRIRQNLVRTGWFQPESFQYSRGRKGTTYYLGKEEVEACHAGNTSAFNGP